MNRATPALLLLALLSYSALAAAQVVTPSLASDNGAGGGCPDAAVEAVAAEGLGRPDDVPPPAAASVAAEVPARSTPVRSTPPAVRPKPAMRWHSFLPGMMK